MERPESPCEIEGIDTDDFAIGVSILQDLESDIIGGVLESGHDESSIDKNIVAVACGEAIVVEESGFG